MARILDFYQVRWEYEPHTFPILWNLDGAVVESFSPDFWLPDLDLYLEMTTLRQKLVRKKNRKLRRRPRAVPGHPGQAVLRPGLPGADAEVRQARPGRRAVRDVRSRSRRSRSATASRLGARRRADCPARAPITASPE